MGVTKEEIFEFRAQVKELTEEQLRAFLGYEAVEWRWNSVADELNRKRTARWDAAKKLRAEVEANERRLRAF